MVLRDHLDYVPAAPKPDGILTPVNTSLRVEGKTRSARCYPIPA